MALPSDVFFMLESIFYSGGALILLLSIKLSATFLNSIPIFVEFLAET